MTPSTLKYFYRHSQRALAAALLMLCWVTSSQADAGAKIVATPYAEQKAVFEFYFDHPEKIGGALYWILGMFHTLNEEPYAIAPDFVDVKVVLHGTEIVTLARHNYEKYRDVVERMRYYTEFGVEFRVCALSAAEFGYTPEDFHDFVHIVPNAVTELVHWQSKGYSLIIPQVPEKHHSIEELK
ncbi:MAG TPA: DsrE family protein [Gammaproteobacteria bacterium]